MKKARGILVLILFILFMFQAAVLAEGFDVGVDTAILIDAATGQVLFEKNADEQLPPASITKIMTLLLAMEQVEKGALALDDEVTISKLAESMGGSQIFLAAGTRVKMGELLEAVTIASGNDASVAVAEAIAGTYSNFISMMNDRAKELGMKNTHFDNSTGLPTEHGEHYSTARDIGIMARELVKYPQVLEWASIWVKYLDLPNRRAMLANTNKLINKYPNLDGLKTGHTGEAGYCLAATAERNEMRLISVVMRAPSETVREEVTTRLLDYGFNAFARDLMIKKGEQVQNIEIPNGKKTTTTAEAAGDLYVLYQRGTKDSLSKEVILEEGLEAPIKKGDLLGREAVMQDGKVLAEVDLVAAEDVDRAGFLTRIWRSFVNWIGGLIKGILG